MGKTELSRRLAEHWPPERVFVHDPKDQFPAYAWAAEDCLEMPGSLIIVDEAHRVCRPGGYVAGWEWLRLLVHEGRHHGLTGIFCARRPAAVHYDLRALASVVYVGRVTASRDLEALVKDVDEDCIYCKDLDPYKFLRFFP